MRFATCIYCDDIRQEVGGKVSFMGIYHGDLLVPHQPTILPKLCFVITAVTARDHPFSNMVVRVASKEKIFLEQELEIEALDQLQRDVAVNTDLNDSIPRTAIVINLAIASFVVDAEYTIKATVIADGEEIPAGRLKVGFAESWPLASSS